MTLFLSDLHLGRGTPAEQAAAERDLLALLRAYEAEIEDHGALYFVGDVFDQYLEYKHLAPKGFVRFLGLLAEWSDQGVPITYLVGNRDPWHLDYAENELGLRLIRTALTEEIEGHRAYIAHGDGFATGHPLLSHLRPLLRHPATARLYRMSLPGDSGYAFARWFARRFGSGGAVGTDTTTALRMHAETLLTETDADLVVFGHCHEAACIPMAGGAYLNPGYWFADRTFGTLDADGPALHQWTSDHAERLTPAPSALSSL